MDRQPADDVRIASRLATELLDSAAERDWTVPAGDLEWDCRTTAGHIADALGFYAGHLGGRAKEWLKFDIVPHADASNGHLARLIGALGEVLAQITEVTPHDAVAYHHSGMRGRDTIAAMGCLEALVHTGDIAQGLDIEFDPPRDLCSRVIRELFSGAPKEPDSWRVLSWATGRGELEGEQRLGPEWPMYWARRAARPS